MKDPTLLQHKLMQLSESEKKYRSIFENATEGIFQVTPEGRFLSANPALARMVGYDSPEDLMKNVTDVAQQIHVSPDRRLEYVKLLATEGEVVSNFECQLHRRDGTPHWVCLSSRAVRDGEGSILYFEGYLHEIHERKLAEQQLLLQRDLALELARAFSLDEALSLTLHAVTQASGCDCAGIYLRNSATGEFELASSAGLSEEFQKRISRVAAGSEKPEYLPVDDDMDGPFKEAFMAEGIRSVAMIPIIYKGGIIACFNAGTRGTDMIPEYTRSTLELIGAQFGNIIARLQAEREVEKDLQRLKETEEMLEIKSHGLEEMNSALKVLLNGREKDKDDLAGKVLSNLEQLIQPYLAKLKTSRLDLSQQAWVEIIDTNLREITSPFLKNIAAFDFTPKELEVIQLMKEGRTSKEIAQLLHVCSGAVEAHRHRIRKKLGLNNKKTNLQTYLSSLA